MARSELDLGHYKGVEHTIELEDPKPFKQRYRRIPPHMFEEVRDHLRQLEACGVIRPSKSQYSSPVVCCRKKDGKLRLCVDYRLLNSERVRTIIAFPVWMKYWTPSEVPNILAASTLSRATIKFR